MFEDIQPYIPTGQTIVMIIAGFTVLAYILFYFAGRQYNRRDGFASNEVSVEQGSSGKPYTTSPIMKLADYDSATELDVIAQQEGERSAADERINRLASARPFEWSNLPSSSYTFQENQAKWLLDSNVVGSKSIDTAASFGGYSKEGFTGTQSTAVQPPDYDEIEAEEQRILSTYVPEKSANLTHYSVEDVDNLIERVYKARGLIPEVKRAPSGVYEVVATRPINEKVLFEDEVEANVVREGGGAAATIDVPSAAEAVAAGLDPFYEPRTSMRPGRNTYMQWTPGLERAFAPTENKLHWY